MANKHLPITRLTVLNALQALADTRGNSDIGTLNTKDLCKELFRVYEESTRGDGDFIKWGEAPRHLDPSDFE